MASAFLSLVPAKFTNISQQRARRLSHVGQYFVVRALRESEGDYKAF